MRKTAFFFLICFAVAAICCSERVEKTQEETTDNGNKATFLGKKITTELGEKLRSALVLYGKENPEYGGIISKTVSKAQLCDNGALWIGAWVAHPEDGTLKYAEPPAKIYRTYIATLKYLQGPDEYRVTSLTYWEKRRGR